LVSPLVNSSPKMINFPSLRKKRERLGHPPIELSETDCCREEEDKREEELAWRGQKPQDTDREPSRGTSCRYATHTTEREH